MKKTLLLYLILCIIPVLIIPKNTFAQISIADSSSQQNGFKNAISVFNKSLGEESPIYNGPEYSFYPPIYKGNAYFMDINSFTSGSIYYDGILFKNVPMLYDLYSDKVVVLLYNHFSKFSLLNDRLKSFDFSGHHFINILADSLEENSNIKPGIYDQLYNGKLQVLVKRTKNIQNSPGTTGVESYFNPVTDYFLKKNNVYYRIGGEGSFINVLKDKKKELQQYIKANKIKFRKTPEESMVKLASYYGHLTN